MAHTVTTPVPTPPCVALPTPTRKELAEAGSFALSGVEDTRAALQKACGDYDTAKDNPDASEETVREIGERYERAMADWTEALETYRDMLTAAELDERECRLAYQDEYAWFQAEQFRPGATRRSLRRRKANAEGALAEWTEALAVLTALGVPVDTAEPDGADQ